MKTRLIILTFVALVSTLPPGRVDAQTGIFFDEFGAGPRAMALGQAFTALADDPSAAYYNPAGLVRTEGIFVYSIGYIYGKPRISAEFSEEPEYNISEELSIRGLYTGIASDLDIDSMIEVYPWLEPLAFGLVSWINLPEINQYHTPPTFRTPYFLRYNDRFQLIALAISLAYEIVPGLSVGVGMMPQVTSTSVQKSFEAINKTDDPVHGLRLSINQKAEMLMVPVAGLLFSPPWRGLSGKLSLGLSYRGEMKSFHGKGPLTQGFGFETEEGAFVPIFVIPEVQVINLVSFNPRQLTVGAAWKSRGIFTLSGDVTWKDWSDFEYFMEQKPSPGFSDTFVPRAGAEYILRPEFLSAGTGAINTLSVRAGYYWEPSPVGDMSGAFNILDSDQHVLSAGFGVDFNAWGVDHMLEGFFQVHLLAQRKIRNDEDPLFGQIEIDGEVYSIGLSYMMKL